MSNYVTLLYKFVTLWYTLVMKITIEENGQDYFMLKFSEYEVNEDISYWTAYRMLELAILLNKYGYHTFPACIHSLSDKEEDEHNFRVIVINDPKYGRAYSIIDAQEILLLYWTDETVLVHLLKEVFYLANDRTLPITLTL